MSITPERVMQLLGEGMTQSQIARKYGVTRQYIFTLAKRGGHQASAQEYIKDDLPWANVPDKHFNNTILSGLRIHARYMERGQEGLRGSSCVKLLGMYRKLVRFNQVIDYDESYPPVEGLSNTGGFMYVPRSPEDGNLIIKMKPGVRITKRGARIWQLPKKFPKKE
ncbi:hypothetical protein BRL53_03235 [Corynebacterium ulcerans]|uniref:helix-turn-helix domain-containing protein n=1 Tax=Corynebacterium ulcerans TaxID=65058 RepID=UPI000C78B8DD|nr:helix-turn-helix domain-containing protein [Corynebacterium ulcerans]MBH5303308.1 helix-turn-helix domain-containing protein [Corynebacterium ulcerans]PLW00839.1 hypothetical protein BRL53_03235 [Corynebacterium ulcerans]